jgi:hypothetical protein
LGFGGIYCYEEEDKEERRKQEEKQEDRKRKERERKRTEKGQKKDRKRKEKGKKKERKGEKVTVWSRLFRNFVFALASLRITHRSHISKELKLKAERKDEGGRKNERNRMQREKKEAGGQIYLPRKGMRFRFLAKLRYQILSHPSPSLRSMTSLSWAHHPPGQAVPFEPHVRVKRIDPYLAFSEILEPKIQWLRKSVYP